MFFCCHNFTVVSFSASLIDIVRLQYAGACVAPWAELCQRSSSASCQHAHLNVPLLCYMLVCYHSFLVISFSARLIDIAQLQCNGACAALWAELCRRSSPASCQWHSSKCAAFMSDARLLPCFYSHIIFSTSGRHYLTTMHWRLWCVSGRIVSKIKSCVLSTLVQMCRFYVRCSFSTMIL
jgi:hypothetical protein